MSRIASRNHASAAVCFAVLLLTGAPGCGERAETQESAPGPSGPGKVVKTVQITATPASGHRELVGVLEAHRKVRVASELGGPVEALLFEKGAQVREGQLLAEIGTRSLRLEVQRAAAALAAAESQLEKAERGSRPEEIRIAEAALGEAEAAWQEARKAFERTRELYGRQAVSDREQDAAKRILDMAHAGRMAAEERLALARQGPREEDRRAARAQVAQAAAGLALAEDLVRKSRVTAPGEGVAAFREVEVGEVIPPGTALTEVVDLSRFKIRLAIGEQDIHRLAGEGRIPFTVDAVPGGVFHGRISFRSPTADPVTRSFPLELEVERTDPRMADGMTVRVRFALTDRRPRPRIPSAWLAEDNGRLGIFVAQGEKALFRAVTLGEYYEQRVEIRSGLEEGERVIITPAGLEGRRPDRGKDPLRPLAR